MQRWSCNKLTTLSIKDIKHLCLQLKTSPEELKAIYSGISSNPKRYYYFRVIEKNGKKRMLATPFGRFREIISRLNALLQRLYYPDNMHGGLRGRTTKTYAKPHVGKSSLLKSDIEDFFPSVRPGKVYDVFQKKLNCSPDVSRYLTRLTTLNGQLPQGSPTSTIVANLVSIGIAQRIQGLANTFSGQSGTFVDDVVLSGPRYINKFKPIVKKIIRQEGFRPNDKKTVFENKKGETVIAGIRMENGFDAPSDKIKTTRALIELVHKNLKNGTTVDEKTIRSIKGRVRYINGLNRGAAQSLYKRLNKRLRTQSK